MKTVKTILLVDDDPIANFINKRLLEKMQIAKEVKVLLNGEEAIDYVKEVIENSLSLPEYIFLDINMPVMDGFEFIANFRALNISQQKTTIIVLSTSTHSTDKKRMEDSGVNYFLNKPLTEGKVKETLDLIQKESNKNFVMDLK